MRFIHASLPGGRSRCRLVRSRSNSFGVSGLFTCSTQSTGHRTGQSGSSAWCSGPVGVGSGRGLSYAAGRGAILGWIGPGAVAKTSLGVMWIMGYPPAEWDIHWLLRGKAWPWWNHFLGSLRRAFMEFSQQVERCDGRPAKTELARREILSQVGDFTLADLQAQLPGISAPLLMKVLAEMKAAGQLSLTGRGRGATWMVRQR